MKEEEADRLTGHMGNGRTGPHFLVRDSSGEGHIIRDASLIVAPVRNVRSVNHGWQETDLEKSETDAYRSLLQAMLITGFLSTAAA